MGTRDGQGAGERQGEVRGVLECVEVILCWSEASLSVLKEFERNHKDKTDNHSTSILAGHF